MKLVEAGRVWGEWKDVARNMMCAGTVFKAIPGTPHGICHCGLETGATFDTLEIE